MECIDFNTLLTIGFKNIDTIFSILSFGLGIYALTIWRKQIKYKVVYENALQFEASMTRFMMHTSGESDVSGNKYLKDFNEQMVPSYWLLLQRDFMVEETKKLYGSYTDCMNSWRETNEAKVPEKIHKEFLESLNAFSLKLRKTF